MADFAKDVSTYSAAASSRRRPAGGGRCARAALGGGHYCRYVLSQLSKPPLGQWVIPFRWLRDIDGDDPEDILILALYARPPQYGMDRFCTSTSSLQGRVAKRCLRAVHVLQCCNELCLIIKRPHQPDPKPTFLEAFCPSARYFCVISAMLIPRANAAAIIAPVDVPAIRLK
jgi:hypothetical protein